jgi:hypothetical protein
VPAEHGGWGLTLEPGTLGVLLAPSIAGVLLGVAALLAFLLRTPLRLILLRRLRSGERMTTEAGQARQRLATRVAMVEVLAIGLALAGTAVLAEDPDWIWPLALALPMFVIATYFDLRSESRHIVPQIAGSVAVAAVAAMGTLAGGGTGALALGAWLILSARVFSSIPHVRDQIRRIHGRDVVPRPGIIGDLAAIWTAALAVLLESSLALGAAAIVGLVVVQRVTLAQPPRPAKVLGVRQMVLGLAVVGVTTVGVWIS